MALFFLINKNESMRFSGKQLFRIVSKKAINRAYISPMREKINIKAGKTFGWAESENNLPDDDSAVFGIVMGNTNISSGSYIDPDSTVCGKNNIVSTYLSKSNVKNANLSSAVVISSFIDGSNDIGVVVDGPSRLIESSVHGKAKITGKCNIGDACISGNAEISGNVLIRKSASFDVNSENGFPDIGGNCIVRDNAGIYGPVKLSENITVKDNAVISGNVEICGNGTVAGDAAVGLIDKLPAGTIKLVSPNISQKEDFGVATRFFGETRSGVFCYRKNDRYNSIEFVSIISGEEVSRHGNFHDFLSSSITNISTKKAITNTNNKTFDLVRVFSQLEIVKILTASKIENPLNVYAAIATEILLLAWFAEHNKREYFEKTYSRLLNCCFFDIKTKKPCGLRNPAGILGYLYPR